MLTLPPSLGLGLGLVMGNRMVPVKVREIAFVGDSITAEWGTGNSYLPSIGASSRAFGGSLWEPVFSAGQPYFAAGGTTSAQHLATYLPSAISSGAKLIAIHSGTNDKSAGVTDPATTAANIDAMVVLCQTAGAIPVISTVMGPTSSGDAAKSAWVATLNDLVRAIATTREVPIADIADATDASAGVSATDVLRDNLHPTHYGSWTAGSVFAAAFAPYLSETYTDDWYAAMAAGLSGEIIPTSGNWKFGTVGGSTPSGCSVTTTAWVGSAITQSIVSRGDKGNWWQLVCPNATPGSGSLELKFSELVRRREETATAGGASTITLDGAASASVDIYKNHRIWITSGTGAGQTRVITAYSAGRVATVDVPWVTVPNATSGYTLGMRTGERFVSFAEFEADPALDLRGLGLNFYHSEALQSGHMMTDAGSINISPVMYALPTSNLIALRGRPSAAPAYGSTQFGWLLARFAGAGTIRVGRAGILCIDRTPNQLTFTP